MGMALDLRLMVSSARNDRSHERGRPSNNGLEQTGSAANGLRGPCSSIQCSPDLRRVREG